MKSWGRKLIFLVLFLFISFSVNAAYYSKVINGKKMTLRAPYIIRTSTGAIATSGKTKAKKVYFIYENQLFRANKVILKDNKIYLQNGFWGSSKKTTLQGEQLIYNLGNNYFDSSDIEVTSGIFQITTARLHFYGKRIEFQKARLGLTFLDFGLRFDTIDIYPGWTVIKELTLGTKDNIFYRVSAWVVDLRLNAFKIPDPLPEYGMTKYRGSFLLLNTHYYFNQHLYGFARIGSSQYKGAMVGVGQIVRFSDTDQFYIGGDFWQVTKPQIKAEYNHSFMKLPFRKRRPTFGEILEYNENVRKLDSSDVWATYTKREVVNDEEIDRDLEFGYSGNFSLTKKLGLHLDLTSGQVYEYFSNIQSLRTNSDFNFSYDYPLGWIKPLVWGIGYTRSDYDLRPFTWQRVYGTLDWYKDWYLLLLGITYTHYFHDEGGSPFIFDQKYVVPHNNILYNLRFGSRKYHLGVKFLSDVILNELVDTTYYFKWLINGWGLSMSYSTQRIAFAMGITLEAF